MPDEKDDDATEPDFDIKPGAKILDEDDADLLVGADVVPPVLADEIEETPAEDDDEGLEIDSFDDSDDL